MIVKRTWTKSNSIWVKYEYTGYFLLGFIPLFISRETIRKY